MSLDSKVTLKRGIREYFAQQVVRSLFNIYTNADTNIFEDDYTVPHACILRIIVALDTSTLLSYVLTRDETTVRIDLNAGSSLTANAAYMFDISFKKDDVVNFQVFAACTVIQLDVYKIRVMGP